MQSGTPHSFFHQHNLHNWVTASIANERIACTRSGPKIKTRLMTTERKEG